MYVIGIALMILTGIVSLVCWIMVLIKMFKSGNVGLGILSIFCQIVAFIWGWVKAGETGLKPVMLAWTVAWVLSIPSSFMVLPGMMKMQSEQLEQLEQMQQEMQAP